MKCKDWFVIEKDGEYYAIEDKHEGVRPKGVNIVGMVMFEKPTDAIEYIKLIESTKPMRRK